MAEGYSGQGIYVSFDGVELNPQFRSFEISGSAKTDDTTAGAETAESHIVISSGFTFDFSGLDLTGATGQAVRAVLQPGHQGALIYGPEGNGTGKPKYECQATVTSAGRSLPYDKVVELKATFQRNGDWVANYDDDPLDVF